MRNIGVLEQLPKIAVIFGGVKIKPLTFGGAKEEFEINLKTLVVGGFFNLNPVAVGNLDIVSGFGMKGGHEFIFGFGGINDKSMRIKGNFGGNDQIGELH